MGICSPFVADNAGRTTLYTSATRPTSGSDFYVGKIIFETDTLKVMLCTSIAAGGTWREITDGDGLTSFTPTIAGTGFALGNGLIGGMWWTVINRIEWFMAWQYGSTSTSGAGPLTFTSPATMVATALPATSAAQLSAASLSGMGGVFYDLSATRYYPLKVLYGSTTTVQPMVETFDGSAAGVAYVYLTGLTSAIPIAPGTGDIYYLHCSAVIA